jgi:hypothetical protein
MLVVAVTPKYLCTVVSVCGWVIAVVVVTSKLLDSIRVVKIISNGVWTWERVVHPVDGHQFHSVLDSCRTRRLGAQPQHR